MREYAERKLKADYIATGHYARLWYRNHHDDIDKHLLKSPLDCIEESLVGTPEGEWIYDWGGKITPLLLSGADPSKDQSYFLCGVKGSAFQNVIFPLGNLIKDNKKGSIIEPNDVIEEEINFNTMSVREIASLSHLPTASKKDSMGICFIGKRKFPAFISEYLPRESFPSKNFIDVDTGQVSIFKNVYCL